MFDRVLNTLTILKGKFHGVTVYLQIIWEMRNRKIPVCLTFTTLFCKNKLYENNETETCKNVRTN